MTTTPVSQGILLVDDGELDDVARVLDNQGIVYERLRGGMIPDEVPPPRDLLIVTPRRVERVRRGSPAGAKPGRPLRIVAVDEDSPAMRRRLRRSGLHLLIRLPAEDEVWRLLVARALYKGSERREDPRVAVGSPVWLERAAQSSDEEPSAPFEKPSALLEEPSAVLMDLSNRGCRLRTHESLSIGDPIEFTIPADSETAGALGALTLQGRVRRLVLQGVQESEAPSWLAAVVFEPEMAEPDRIRLTSLINHWASGPRALTAPRKTDAPTIPSCQLPSLPDLTLDDETDPPIAADREVRVQLGTGRRAATAAESTPSMADSAERRTHGRGRFEAPLVAESAEGPFVLIGRDLSPGGMRIERHPDLHLGDSFQIGLRGPGATDPFLVEAEIVRDDGPEGFGVRFATIDRKRAAELEKMVACLPDVESLEDGEIAGLGAILSEIISR